MRVVISLGAFIIVFLAGVRTEWVSVSKAALNTTEERAYEAVMLGETRPDATSGELIDAAVGRGEISPDEALLYGVYLGCGDERLPQQFRGQNATPPPANILWEADVDWASLSPDVRLALRHFFQEAMSGATAAACTADIERLAADPEVWWAPALVDSALPASIATR